MKNITGLIAGMLLLFLGSCTNDNSSSSTEVDNRGGEATTTKEHRIVSLNGTITELLYELGAGEQLVGVDVTSTYPAAAQELPKLGHVSQLNPEGILALQPTVVFVDKSGEESAAIQTIKDAGVDVQVVDIEYKLSTALELGKSIATHLELEDSQLEGLETRIATNERSLTELKAKQTSTPSILFIYARGTKTLMVGGKNTSVDAMINLVGAKNAAANIEDFKPLTPEALLEAQPDIVLMFTKGLASLQDEQKSAEEALFALPALAMTPAAQNKRVIAMDGQYLSGFGPRASDAAVELAEEIYQ